MKNLTFFVFLCLWTSTSLALCPSYVVCREEFLSAAKTLLTDPNHNLAAFSIPTKSGRQLWTDLLTLRQGKNDSLVVFISGTHGVEGPTGSTFQTRLLKSYGSELLPKNHDYVFIHALNPFGFAMGRRVSESNIDLNRNFSTDLALYSEKNPGYREVSPFLNPTTQADPGLFTHARYLTNAIWLLLQKGMAPLRQAILLGQYEQPEGLYFGGQAPEPIQGLLEPQLRPLFSKYKKILVIDLHTGFGERGRLHLFPNPQNAEQRKRIERVFDGFEINFGDQKDFYTIKGAVVDWMMNLSPVTAEATPMVFEYGTKDSQTTWGSLQSLRTMILENQDYFHGAVDLAAHGRIESMIWEMYAPSAPEWEQKCWQQTEAVLKKTLSRY